MEERGRIDERNERYDCGKSRIVCVQMRGIMLMMLDGVKEGLEHGRDRRSSPMKKQRNEEKVE
jgi:hypothetical protein